MTEKTLADIKAMRAEVREAATEAEKLYYSLAVFLMKYQTRRGETKTEVRQTKLVAKAKTDDTGGGDDDKRG